MLVCTEFQIFVFMSGQKVVYRSYSW